MGLKSKAEKWISAILFKLFDDFAMSRIHFVHVVDNSWKINSNCCTLDVSKSRRLPYIIDHTIQDSDLWDFVVRHSSWNSEIFDIWCESLCNTDMNAIFVGCMPRYFFFMFTFSSTVDSIRGWTFFVSFWVLLRSTVRSTLAYYTFSIRRRLTILKKKIWRSTIYWQPTLRIKTGKSRDFRVCKWNKKSPTIKSQSFRCACIFINWRVCSCLRF